jgi:hypothetical protein
VPTQVRAFAARAAGIGAADIVSGRAGLLLALEHGTRHGNDVELLSVVATLAAELHDSSLAVGGGSSSTFPAGASPLTCIPAGDAGIALALHRASGRAPAVSTIGAEGEPSAGALLAVLSMAANETEQTPALAAALSQANDWLRDARRMPGAHAARECAEVALAAFQAGGGAAYRELACERAEALLAGYEATGSWFPDSLAADRHHLSAITGVGGLAHLFARLHAPHRLPSIRTVG